MLFCRILLNSFDGTTCNRQFISPAFSLKDSHWSHYGALAISFSLTRIRCGVTVIECPKRSSTSSQFACFDTSPRGNHSGEAKVLITSHLLRKRSGATGDPMTPRGWDRGHCVVNPRHIHTWWTKRRTHKDLCTHKVNHALGYAHMDADAHLDDYSRPPGASLKLFSRDLAKRERGSEMSISGSENERRRESLNFNRMLPGENSHHLCVSSVPKSHSFLSELKDPDCSDILSGKLVCRRSLSSCFLGWKSFDESVAKGFSYPVLALDNDIPPAVANSSRAEDVPEDKCHYQLSVMWSGFQLHHPYGSVCVFKGKFLLCVSCFCSWATISGSYDNIAIAWVQQHRTGCKKTNKLARLFV